MHIGLIGYGKMGHEIEKAAQMVYQAIGCQFDYKTNYHAPQAALRKLFCEDVGKRQTIQKTNQPPVFVLWVTDGECNVNYNEALNEFRSSKFNPMFIKIIALRGKQDDQQFKQLHAIAREKGILPNIDLVILDDPDELSIQLLFKGYRTWLEEAHEHGMLENDPGISFNHANPDDQEELRQKEALEIEHGHDHEHSAGTAYGAKKINLGGLYAAKRPLLSNSDQDNNCCRCVIL